VLERNGRRFSIRPEKIRILDADADGIERGHVRDVVYVGMVTRYVVELDGGGELTVVSQNLETTSADVLEARGRRVTLDWRSEHTYELDKEGA
jgi:putative spermidine/putrescine transport system ATP-binding protein